MSRFILSSVLLALIPTASASANRNVVLLISDNQNQDDCGCYGNPVIQTPSIDRLAREGILFREAFATTASCGPSRAVIYSGLQTHANGQYGHGHGIHTFRLSPKVQTVFALLKDHGYHTALLGKQHTTHPESYPFTFDRKVSGRDVRRLAEVAGEFIQQAGDEPFFLTIGYSDPHPTSIERPGWGIKRQDAEVPIVTYSQDEVIVPSYLPDRGEVREGLAGYYQEISRLDHGVGLILDLLEATGRAKDTLVIFTSDHGSSEPGAMANHYEPGIRVPFIVRQPAVAAGKTRRAMVTLADITPTILDWTQAPGPKYPLHGRSLLAVLDGQDHAGWDEVFLSHVCHEVTQYYPMRTLRDRRYKLIWNVDWRSEYPLPIDTLRRATWTETVRRGDPTIGKRSIKKFLFRDQVELYDLQADPDEIVNLADSTAHQKTREELSQRLVQWLETTDDPWLVRHRLPMPGEPESISSRQAIIDTKTGYQSLDNGTNLDGQILERTGHGFRVVDQSLGRSGDETEIVFRANQYTDFSLRYEFRFLEGAGNALQNAWPLREAAVRRGALRPAGQWNQQETWCKDRRIVVIVNDIVILDQDLSRTTDEKILEERVGQVNHLLSGDASGVRLRNVRVKELLDSPQP